MSKKWLIWLFPVLFTAVYFGVNKIWPIVGINWKETYYPAARALLEGKNPYLVPTFRNPPWTILFLVPFALFSETIGGILFFMASLILYAWSAYRLKASLVALIAFMLAPPVVYGMRMLNVDVFVLIGFTLPAPAALLFVIIKPQMGAAIVPFLLFKAFKEGGIKQVLATCAPVSIAAAFSFLVFGDWFSGRQAILLDSFWNASLWPWAVPIGVVLMVLSLRDLREDFAMAASPFLSPYLAYHSWTAVLAGLIKYDFEFVVAVLAMWLVAVIKSFGLA